MKVFYWNIRGIGNPRSQMEFSNFCRIHKPDFICIAEPMVDFSSIPSHFWLSLNLTLVAVNDRGSSLPNILVLCNNLLDPRVICNSSQQISVQIELDNVTCLLTFVYAFTNPYTRRQQTLSDLSLNCGPWMGTLILFLDPMKRKVDAPLFNSLAVISNKCLIFVT